MKKRIVEPHPVSAVDPLEAFVRAAGAMPHGVPAGAEAVALKFSEPEHGWMEMGLTVNGHTVDWWLSNVPDPFALPWKNDTDGISVTFLYWLEALANGRSATLGFDMEGPFGAWLVSGGQGTSTLVFSCAGSSAGLEFAVSIERFVLVRDIYSALLAYWDSDRLNANWSHWSDRPRWSLRSRIVEDYLAAARPAQD